MINYEALFKVSYGLYIVTSGDRQKGNGYISNTFFQVTSNPPQFAACCSKNNYTAELIFQTGYFSVSILTQHANADLIGLFGYQSGRQIDKMQSRKLMYGESGVPIVLDDAIAYLEFKVNHINDVGTHWLFIADLLNAEVLDDTQEALTYLHYRHVKKGVAPPNAPTYIDKSKLGVHAEELVGKRFECRSCGFIFDEANGDLAHHIKPGSVFADLPDDWLCPVCGAHKVDFVEMKVSEEL
jgi:flavin reductase (DIM6/NTAB) family NADH-FMN oxidoreductase RutF/rubredoxin